MDTRKKIREINDDLKRFSSNDPVSTCTDKSLNALLKSSIFFISIVLYQSCSNYTAQNI